jgi:hypothetical protein
MRSSGSGIRSTTDLSSTLATTSRGRPCRLFRSDRSLGHLTEDIFTNKPARFPRYSTTWPMCRACSLITRPMVCGPLQESAGAKRTRRLCGLRPPLCPPLVKGERNRAERTQAMLRHPSSTTDKKPKEPERASLVDSRTVAFATRSKKRQLGHATNPRPVCSALQKAPAPNEQGLRPSLTLRVTNRAAGAE